MFRKARFSARVAPTAVKIGAGKRRAYFVSGASRSTTTHEHMRLGSVRLSAPGRPRPTGV